MVKKGQHSAENGKASKSQDVAMTDGSPAGPANKKRKQLQPTDAEPRVEREVSQMSVASSIMGKPTRKAQQQKGRGIKSYHSHDYEVDSELSEEDMEEGVHRQVSTFEKSILNSAIPDAVVKVYCTHCEPNFSVPWTTKRQMPSTSTGFVWGACKRTGKKLLLTNAHSVDRAAIVQVRKRGDHQKYEAQVVCVGPDCDLALLSVDDEKFWEGLSPLKWGNAPRLEDPVTVVGYPVGGDNTSVTQGVVSRIDLQQYSNGSITLLVVQIDAAINPGNSGGPALNAKKECVGIAFQSLKDGETENLGYLIPAEVVRHFMEDYEKNGRYTGFGDGGFAYSKLENKHMRRALGLDPQSCTGVMVKKVDKTAPASKVLEKGDILLEIDGLEVASDATIPFRNGERIPFHWQITSKFVDDSCQLKIFRKGKTMDVTLPLTELRLLVPTHLAQDAVPEYLIVGGLVFVPLTEPMMKSDYGEEFDTRCPVRLMDRWLHGLQEEVGQQVVVLSHVLANECTIGYASMSNIIVRQFNGKDVLNIKQLHQAVEACKDEFFRFDLDHDEVIILEAKAARAALPNILKTNMIPSHKSVNI